MNGQGHSHLKKLEVAAAYNAAMADNGGLRPNISALQRDCKVSRMFVRRIELELEGHQRILHPSETRRNGAGPSGPGARTLDEIDAAVILFLYLEEPSRSYRSYIRLLEELLGTVVSRSTLSRFFLYTFPHRGGLCRPNLVPIDKFRPDNIE